MTKLGIAALVFSVFVSLTSNALADEGTGASASAPAANAPSASPQEATIDTPVPSEWLPTGAMRCIRRGRLRGFCAGPRRVPRPSDDARERAEALGLGTRNAASRLLLEAPRDEWVSAAGTAVAADTLLPNLLWPLEGGTVWRHFGRVRHRRRVHQHAGVDLGAAEGTRIRAVNEGLIAYSDNEVTGYGNLVLVVHPDRSVTFYAHCRAIYVVAGQHVARGQVLGEVGDTGYARGTHLHFEWHVGGRARDPLHHFVGFPANVHITPADEHDEEAAPADELPAQPRSRTVHRSSSARSRSRSALAAPRHGRRRVPETPRAPRSRSRQNREPAFTAPPRHQ